MACYGIVTRLDGISKQRTLVGLHFYKLEMSQRIVLAQGLARKLKETQDRGHVDDLLSRPHSSLTLSTLPQLITMAVLGLAWSVTIGILLRFEYSGLYQMLLKLFLARRKPPLQSPLRNIIPLCSRV